MKEENKNSDSLISLFETKKSLTITLLRARESLMMSFRPLLAKHNFTEQQWSCLLYTSPSPRDAHKSRMPSSA